MPRPRRRTLALFLLGLAAPVGGQQGIQLRVELGRERLRPYEAGVLRARAAGGARLPAPEPSFRIVQPGGGWLSKPFRSSGPDDPGDARFRDAVLYTAPAATGRYTIEAQWNQHRAHTEIEVTHAAPSFRPGESTDFGSSIGARDVYRELAEHYAPLICQETWFEPKADFLVRFDYDGDWRGDNNWDNLAAGSSQAYVYYTAMETATHYFLAYNFFYPRDYSDQCGPAACHENDSEGLVLAIRKDGSRYGKLLAMETTAQNQVYSYSADSRIRDGAHQVAGEVKLWRDSHPVVFVESGSHAVFSAADSSHSRFSLEKMAFTASTGVTYRFGGSANRPAHPDDRDVSYELLAITEHWWPRAVSREGSDGRAFDEYFRYAPLGNRPAAVADEIAGAFLGRKHAANRARPFWAWPDPAAQKRRMLAPGQWALDPAYAFSINLKLPAGMPFSLDYIHNPFLEGGGRGAVIASPRAAQSPTPAAANERYPLSPPAEKPNYRLQSKEGSLEFRCRVDGSLYLYVRGDQIEVEYLSGRPVDEIRYRFSQPLPAVELEEARLDGVEGRGSVRLLEWPNPGNQFTAKVRIQDDKAGAGNYKFKLVWKR